MNNNQNSIGIKNREINFWLPLKLFISYIIITLIVNFWGPWEYVNYNWDDKIIVFLFLTIFLISHAFSYGLGIALPLSKSIQHKNNNPFMESKILKLSLAVSILIITIQLISGYLTQPFDLTLNATEIMAQAYSASRMQVLNDDVNWALWIYSYGYIFVFISMTLGVYRYKQLSTICKILVIMVYTGAFLNNLLFVGAQKGLGDLITIFLSVLIIKVGRREIRIKKSNMAMIMVGITGIVIFFSTAFSARILLWGISAKSVGGLAYLDIDNFMLSFLPEEVAIGFGIFLHYLSHGYYGLSLCLRLPFEWSMGLGSSFVLREWATRYLDVGSLVLNTTYPERMESEFGWGAYANWHTIFPWLASDVSYIGALIILSVIAYIYAVSWKEAVLGKSWVSVLLFSILNILYVYLPANNQIMQTKGTFLTFCFILLLWLKRNSFMYREK